VRIVNYSEWVHKNLEKLLPNQNISVPFNLLVHPSILEIKESTKLPISIMIRYNNIEGKQYVKEFSSYLEVKGSRYVDWNHPEFVVGWISYNDPIIREFAVKATRGLAPASKLSDIYKAAKRIWDQLSGYGVRYVSDPTGIEYVLFPIETLKLRAGDCEDLAILYAALLKSIGIKTELVSLPNHMLVAFYEDEKMYCVETTLLGSDFLSAINDGYYSCSESEAKLISIDVEYISPVSLKVEDIPVPDIEYMGSEWSLVSNECYSDSIIGCLKYLCKGICSFTFHNKGDGTGRKCGTFLVMTQPWSLLYLTKRKDCVDVTTAFIYKLSASWYDYSSTCNFYSPTCKFYEE
ncbi:MAG: transglutaminase family protein, partial [Candidatus Aenigmarchaeota archaeon]|nr:transglutaminase family protein [Candidatus Aenigmarchaeota archaeon]